MIENQKETKNETVLKWLKAQNKKSQDLSSEEIKRLEKLADFLESGRKQNELLKKKGKTS